MKIVLKSQLLEATYRNLGKATYTVDCVGRK